MLNNYWIQNNYSQTWQSSKVRAIWWMIGMISIFKCLTTLKKLLANIPEFLNKLIKMIYKLL
jgi:hypothetical protein